MKKNIGLFFGSFNPVHIGHMAIANYVLNFSDIDELWFVVSPHNPLKSYENLLPEYHRLEMVRLAINDHPQMRVSNIEFSMPKPSYTIDTLTYLYEKYPEYTFYVIIGGDNMQNFKNWKNYEMILKHHGLIVYPRKDSEIECWNDYENIKITNAPEIEISSSIIRRMLKNNLDVRFFMPYHAYVFLDEMNFYKN